jgi:hypothetical protein
MSVSLVLRIQRFRSKRKVNGGKITAEYFLDLKSSE